MMSVVFPAERDDDAHRLGRIALRLRKRREQQDGDGHHDLQHACS